MKQPTSLNPVIRKALNSLDLQLESELQRYRSKKRKEESFGRVSSSSPAPRISTPLFVDLKSIPDVVSTPSPENSLEDQLLASSLKLDYHLEENSHEEHHLKLPNFKENIPHSDTKITAHLSLEEITSLIHQPKTKDEQKNLATPPVENKPPNEYLESSEQLLASLNEKQTPQSGENSQEGLNTPPSPKVKPSPLKYLATPLGIGSLLLLFLSGALVSSMVFAPETFSHLGLNHWLLGNQIPPDSQPPENTSIANNSTLGVTQGVNLTNEEFIPIELENLSTLQTNSDSVVTPPQSNEVTQNAPNPLNSTPQVSNPVTNNLPSANQPPVLNPNQDLASVLLPPSLLNQGNTVYTEPPTVIPLPPSGGETPDLNNKYLVVIPFSGDNSLNQVRQVVGEAFVRDFPDGKRIQIAAFDTQNEAQQFVTKLSQSGLSASVYTLN
jgi:hypothetical protein